MAKRGCSRGLHDIGNGCWAWQQPDGGWGWSNAGLVTDGEASLLVDTLFDLKLTGEMLAAMRAAVPQAEKIGALVNTHANGDHTYGNQLVEGARIVASQGTAEEFAHVPPAMFLALMSDPAMLGEAGDFVRECFAPFDFVGITLTPPTETFSGETALRVGDREVRLIEVGPAHTKGDTLVHLPGEKVVYTGDILFNEGTPIAWAGPLSNWIAACDRILAMDVEVVVPGHGPVTDKDGVRAMRDYLVFVTEEARRRFDAGLDFLAAAHDIELGRFAGLGDPERLVVNVQTLYDDFAGGERPVREAIPYFAHMKALREKWGLGPVHGHLHGPDCGCGG
ncbi:MBL fold metallo-hydrolase [Albimonas pacifica]|uniref:Glyoxylase, beta-lactamase superfamily II n=1 Tax=Albimonas pacifica TaxID=1114924 RepID=A0A1I3GGG6_9RHOB|nr:MBL fold metallo-hydrolase [Albimonas pacifica]SFI22534.1 Glyoxylase, beta-lactamase superfamily II [Albimonas pacifica]